MDDRRAAELAAAEGMRVAPLSRFTLAERSMSDKSAPLLGYAAYKRTADLGWVQLLARALERT